MAAAVLVVVSVIPVWLVALVVLRDVLLLLLFWAFSILGRPVPVRQIPVTRVGKLATMALLTGLPFLLLARIGLSGGSIIRIAALSLIGVGIIFYYLALGQYAMKGSSAPSPTNTSPDLDSASSAAAKPVP